LLISVKHSMWFLQVNITHPTRNLRWSMPEHLNVGSIHSSSYLNSIEFLHHLIALHRSVNARCNNVGCILHCYWSSFS
jgi:hypothetical protein